MVLLVALVMLAGHSFGVKAFVVDNTSLILLALVLISPLLAAVRKVKFGEFEAEIQPEEVKRVSQQAENPCPRLSRPADPTSASTTDIKKLAIEAGVKGAKNTNFAAHLLSVPDKVFKAANGWELSDKGRVYVAEMTAVVWLSRQRRLKPKLSGIIAKSKKRGLSGFSQ